MAIRVTDEYPGRVVAPNADYQDGSIQNETVPDSSDDGTPLDELWGNDIEGMKQRAFLMAGRTPSGVSDTALSSDIMDSLVDITAPFKVQPLSVAVMKVRVAPGSVGSAVNAEQETGVITAPSVNPRIDVVTIDGTTGTIGIITGAESATPSAPEIPFGSIGVATIDLLVAQTSIVDADITDIRNSVVPNTAMDLKAETITHDMASDADYTLSESENFYGRIVITDTGVLLTGARNIIVSNDGRALFVQNDTAQTLPFKTAAGTGIAIQPSETAHLLNDGVNVTAAGKLAVSFESAELALANTTSVAHGLGASPSMIRGVIRCTTADIGYSIGDEIEMYALSQNSAEHSVTLWADSANIGTASENTTWESHNKAGGAGTANITPAGWRIVLRAWL